MHPRVERVLTEGNVSFECWRSEDQEGKVKAMLEFDKAAAGYFPDRVTKTLFLQGVGGQSEVRYVHPRDTFCLVVAPIGMRVDLKMVAGHLKVPHLRFAKLDAIKQQLGYSHEGISPLACGNTLVIVHEPLLLQTKIWVNAGVAGEHIGIAPADLRRLTRSTAMDLTIVPKSSSETNPRNLD